jgi:hypothetical protein
MARENDEDTHWTKQLLIGLTALAAVALVIGGVVSVVALGAAKVTGIDDPRPARTTRPSLFIPSGEPTTTPQAFPDPAGSADSAPPPRPSPTATAMPRRPASAIRLKASPRRVSANERINLTGEYRRGEGRRLQVQRFEGGWVDFPVSASVSDGSFRTYIFSGRVGPNRFRMIDERSGRASNEVRVVIG